jgi:hypothetical protein
MDDKSSIPKALAEAAEQHFLLTRAEQALAEAASRTLKLTSDASRKMERETREIARNVAEVDALTDESQIASQKLREKVEELSGRGASLSYDPDGVKQLEQLAGAIRGSFVTIEAQRRRIQEVGDRAEHILAALNSKPVVSTN